MKSVRRAARRGRAAVLLTALGGLAASAALPLAAPATALAGPALRPYVSDAEQVSASQTPPAQAQCASRNRRCFGPQAFRASYGLDRLPDGGRGTTIAVVDAFGDPAMEHDLHVFDKAFGFTPLCGEETVSGAACTGLGTFSRYEYGGSHYQNSPSSHGTGQQNGSGWAIETALDVEWAHATAPYANILLVTTPTAETQGVQGFPQIFHAIDDVANKGLADIVSMSLGSGEEAFGSPQNLQNFEASLQNARDHHVTVLASSGDGGTENNYKTPVKNPQPIAGQSVIFPASSPLVTAAGGTSLCTNPDTGQGVDDSRPDNRCTATYPNGNAVGQREVAWRGSGGGFSHVFDRPGYQTVLPAGSTFTGSGRGVPDVAFNADPRTGVLEYVSAPGTGPYLSCGSGPCSAGWYVIGGTSAAAPELAGVVANADQQAHHRLGFLNPALYRMAADPARYAKDFFDVTVGTNTQASPRVTGFDASQGWDPVTGLGTPGANAPAFIADLVAEVRPTD